MLYASKFFSGRFETPREDGSHGVESRKWFPVDSQYLRHVSGLIFKVVVKKKISGLLPSLAVINLQGFGEGVFLGIKSCQVGDRFFCGYAVNPVSLCPFEVRAA